MINNKKLLLSVFSLTFGLVTCYVILFVLSRNSYCPTTAWWINNAYLYKDYLGAAIKKPKIIIASGSNALFGINSEVIKEKTEFPTLNLATHAGLDISFLYFKIKEHIKEGDIVVLPLEFKMYQRDTVTDFFTENMLSWGEKYLRSLSSSELLSFFLKVPKERVFSGIYYHDREKPIKELSEIQQELETAWKANGSNNWNGYTIKSLNPTGDMNIDNVQPTSELLKIYGNGINYIDGNVSLSDHFLYYYRKIEELVTVNNGKLLLTWPVTIRNKSFNLSIGEYQKKTKEFSNTLANHSISIYCNPALFNLSVSFFFNTTYHPNFEGARIRSENLGMCIDRVLHQKPGEMTFTKAISKVHLMEANSKIAKNFRIRKADLDSIKNALTQYRKAHDAYPRSNGFDGLYSLWGYSGEDWIKGLVPEYLETLPRDPRKTNLKNQQYLYRSNGKDYKIISYKPEDCHLVSDIEHSLIDPKRNCYAYGYWTTGAKSW